MLRHMKRAVKSQSATDVLEGSNGDDHAEDETAQRQTIGFGISHAGSGFSRKFSEGRGSEAHGDSGTGNNLATELANSVHMFHGYCSLLEKCLFKHQEAENNCEQNDRLIFKFGVVVGS